MIETALDALGQILAPESIGFMMLGVVVGLMVGILPGLGGTVGMSLFLPFLFGMDTGPAIAMLIGAAAVIHTSDTFPSVLLGVPGSSGSQATIMDGYPLARQGQASRALSAAFISSLAGGLIGAVTLFAILPVARPLVLAFGSPERLMLAVLGLSLVGILAGDRPMRGLIMGIIGLLVGSIGAAPTEVEYRYTFDQLYLFDGLSIAVVALGLFALPEMLDLLARGTSIAPSGLQVSGGRRQGLADVIANRLLVARSAVLGIVVGFVPGLGGAVVDWVSYGVARETVPGGSTSFGSGDIRGVIAPESSNNAKEGGALIPTLLFSIPGSGGTAVLLGGFILLGLQPGPRMLTDDLDVTLLIVWTLALANVFGALACLSVSPLVARLATIRFARLAPFLLIIMLMGAYQTNRSIGDFVAFAVIGLLGWFFRNFGYPLPPLLIGFVLAEGVERNLWLSNARFGASWLLRPGVIALGAVTVALLFASRWLDARSKRSRQSMELTA